MKETLDLGVYLHEEEGEARGRGGGGVWVPTLSGALKTSGSVGRLEDDLTSPFYFSLTSEK